jgi:thioredoxin 1
MAPALDQVEKDYAGQVEVRRLNADDNRETVAALGIRGIPTLVVFRDGHEVARRVGAQSPADLQRLFDQLAQGVESPAHAVSTSQRRLRLIAGAVLMAMGYLAGQSWLVMGVGAVIVFTAVYDRCPIWQSLAARLRPGEKSNAA